MNGSTRTSRPRRRFVVRLLIIVLALFAALMAWRAAHRTDSAGAPTRAAATAPAPTKDADPGSNASTPAPPSEDAFVSASELDDLRTALDQAIQRVQATSEHLTSVESDVAGLRQQFEAQQAAQAKARARQAAASRRAARRRAEQAAAPAKSTPPPPPKVLAVDLWEGEPSVSVLVGSEVRFLSEGDTIAETLVRHADPGTQRVELVTASGDVAAVTSVAAGDPR